MPSSPSPKPTTSDPKYLTLGPGDLTFGSTGSQIEISDYVKSVKVTPSVDAEDPSLVLSGRTIGGDRRYTYSLSFTAYQTLKAGGWVDWAYKNAGKEVPFEFIPRDKTKSANVKGKVIVDPIEIGGDVGTKPTSECEWAIIGAPIFTAESD